ncbi:hypothetical protein [Azospirillum isscasi]|uniref:Uncharacterized protein n=1 Tax=Azospirillum isscasi TaxID=3053926 RepID=A0ABU0WJN1_9PROT|nr:hypothetical protein [Azospirillum isscasi]MDQ2104433.1 hypothetical protein [Azospirillum isscasi]
MNDHFARFRKPADPLVQSMTASQNRPEARPPRIGPDGAPRIDTANDNRAEPGRNTGTRRTPGTHTAEDWLHLYEERAAVREFDGGLPRPEAERLTYEEVLLAWHRESRPSDGNECAACSGVLAGHTVRLPDGAWVHTGCVVEYGRLWRKRAAEALRLAGILSPSNTHQNPNPMKQETSMGTTASTNDMGHSPAWHQGHADGRAGDWNEALAEREDTMDDYRNGWDEGHTSRHLNT